MFLMMPKFNILSSLSFERGGGTGREKEKREVGEKGRERERERENMASNIHHPDHSLVKITLSLI
jgi:hypothetical protein